MAQKSILRVPSLADRLTNARVVRFSRDLPALQNCVTSGLILTPDANGQSAKVTAGKAIVGGTLFHVAEATPGLTNNITNCVWIDDAGDIQVDAAFPASGNFAKVAGVPLSGSGSGTIRAVILSPDYRDWKLGYDPTLGVFVAPAPVDPGTRKNIYAFSSTYRSDLGVKFCQFGYFGQAVIVDQIQVHMSACNVSGTDKAIAARAGFMETDEQTWVEGAYADITLANGSGAKTFTFDVPWVPTLQRQYVLCLELTEWGESFSANDFSLSGGNTDRPAYATGWLFDSTGGGFVHRKTVEGSWAWLTSNSSYWKILGYDAEGAYVEVAAETLTEAPATFQALLNKRAYHAGEYGAIDPATQIVKAEASLDGGAHWAAFAEGEDIGTPHTGTDLIFRVTAASNSAADIQISSVGFAYEV